MAVRRAFNSHEPAPQQAHPCQHRRRHERRHALIPQCGHRRVLDPIDPGGGGRNHRRRMRKPLLAGGRVGGGPDARRLIPASVLPSRSSGSATRERSRTGGGGSSTAWEGSALSRASSRWYAAAQVWTKRVAEASWQAAWWMDTPTQTRGLGTRWPVGRRAPEWSPILAGERSWLG